MTEVSLSELFEALGRFVYSDDFDPDMDHRHRCPCWEEEASRHLCECGLYEFSHMELEIFNAIKARGEE